MSRHAKNRARRLGVSLADVERVINDPMLIDGDREGRLRYTGEVRGIRIRVVIAVDDLDLIVTMHERKH